MIIILVSEPWNSSARTKNAVTQLIRRQHRIRVLLLTSGLLDYLIACDNCRSWELSFHEILILIIETYSKEAKVVPLNTAFPIGDYKKLESTVACSEFFPLQNVLTIPWDEVLIHTGKLSSSHIS